MTWIEYYVPVRHVHLTAVTLSLTLFAARGIAVLAGAHWPMSGAARGASMAIDTVLLAGGVALWAMLGLNPLHDAWLGTKLVLLLAYIAFGSLALRRAHTPRARALFFVAAVACAAFMVSVALAHQPAGIWWLLQGG